MGVALGIQISGQYPDGLPDHRYYGDAARGAEALGYDSIWVGEHLSFHNPTLEIFTALSYFAACTQRVRLGAGVLLLPLRHPSMVAKQANSLQTLSDGRLVLGIGVGGEGVKDFEACGVDITERGRRTDDALAAMEAVWSGPEASHHGPYFDFHDITIEPVPTAATRTPVWIGGRSAAALRRTARFGQGWLGGFCSPERYARSAAEIARQCEAIDRDPATVVRGHVISACVADSTGEGRRMARDHLTRRYGQDFPEHVIERYCLAGDGDSIRERAQEYFDAGVEHLVFQIVTPASELPAQATALMEAVDPLRSGRTRW
ncbi:LLM class flavin-dependent oxidoreductase [Amycolatopsis sp. GM8]|uniref:LLM class flavin-dependent oxidoreductase n=1 Tax=Amycolatopsis sp. GM8 TaxID=2896530 RepID=UPI001F02AFD6|nr:TIGR03619 family F420-dependent LLM class oxidoreductase [Amycolatopsis sp. GM8]